MAQTECTTNLGNQQRVLRVPVEYMNGSVGAVNAPIVPRGSVITFAGTQRPHEAYANTLEYYAPSKSLSFNCTPKGVMAEGMADNYRRQPRKGQKPSPVVLPISCGGIDIATSAERILVAFAPGDPVYVMQNGNLTNVHIPGSAYLGTCNAGAPVGSLNVQLAVDSLALPVILSA